MYGPCALAASPAVEGAFVIGAYNVAAMIPPVIAGAWRAGPGGTALARFGWGSLDGLVRNVRTLSTDVLGIVLPQYGPGVDWRVVFFDDVTLTYRVREGLPLQFLRAGNLWLKFRGGAFPGQAVYANALDGSAISGYSDDGELTPFTVSSQAAPGQLAIVTSWSAPTS